MHHPQLTLLITVGPELDNKVPRQSLFSFAVFFFFFFVFFFLSFLFFSGVARLFRDYLACPIALLPLPPSPPV
jgi:hypothetical protein